MPDKRKLTWVFATVLVLVALSTVTVYAAEECVVKQRMECPGFDFSGYNLNGRALRNSNVDGANLSDTSMRGTNWSGSSMRDTDFTDADTSNTDFSRVDLTGSNITQAQLDAAGSYRRATLPDHLSGNN